MRFVKDIQILQLVVFCRMLPHILFCIVFQQDRYGGRQFRDTNLKMKMWIPRLEPCFFLVRSPPLKVCFIRCSSKHVSLRLLNLFSAYGNSEFQQHIT